VVSLQAQVYDARQVGTTGEEIIKAHNAADGYEGALGIISRLVDEALNTPSQPEENKYGEED